MCKCTPNIRTPWCGKPGCEMPKQTVTYPMSVNVEDGVAHVMASLPSTLTSEEYRDIQVAIREALSHNQQPVSVNVKEMKEHYSTEGIPPELVQSIAFLRQWLNEDRKCIPLVTARDIWHWLEKDFTTALTQNEARVREEERERIRALFPKLNPNSDSWGTIEMERILQAITPKQPL